MTSNDLNLYRPIVKVQAFQILSFACQIKIWSFVCRSLKYVFICDHFFFFYSFDHFFEKISFEVFQNTHLSLIFTQGSWYWSTSNSQVTYSLPDQFQVGPFENYPNKILIWSLGFGQLSLVSVTAFAQSGIFLFHGEHVDKLLCALFTFSTKSLGQDSPSVHLFCITIGLKFTTAKINLGED